METSLTGAQQVIEGIREQMTTFDTVREENAFLSNRFLYEQNGIDQDTAVDGFILDKGPVLDVSGKRNWKRREDVSSYHQGNSDLSYVKEISWDATLDFLENVYTLNDAEGAGYSLAMMGNTTDCIKRQENRDEGRNIGEELEELMQPENLQELYLPDDVYQTQKKWSIALEDWKLCEYAHQNNTAVVTTDSDIGRLKAEIPRYEDIVVMTPETALEYTDNEIADYGL